MSDQITPDKEPQREASQQRGAHPQDYRLFTESTCLDLRQAVSDYSWMLSHGYAAKSALALVGNRFQLHERQRLAVMRCACTDESLDYRLRHAGTADTLAGQTLLLDAYNILTTVEVALLGGVVLEGRDGCYRDIASVYGTLRHVEEAVPAMLLIGETLSGLGVEQVAWYLDSPVSNSGRLRDMLHQIAGEHGWEWQAHVVNNPDPVLAAAQEVIATADGIVLDQCRQWFNLARMVVTDYVPDANVLRLA